MIGSDHFSIVSAFLSLILALGGVIVGLDCLWRVKGQLRTAISFLILAIVPFIVWKIMIIFGYNSLSSFMGLTKYADIFTAAFIFLGTLKLYKIVRSLDNEE